MRRSAKATAGALVRLQLESMVIPLAIWRRLRVGRRSRLALS